MTVLKNKCITFITDIKGSKQNNEYCKTLGAPLIPYNYYEKRVKYLYI